MTKLRCAILDDYQQIALSLADWSAITDQVDIQSFPHHFLNQKDFFQAVKDCQIIVAMRERTKFDAATFASLPCLKLLITTGMRNQAIDLDAAAKHGVTVCGTASMSEPPVELTWALILSMARHIVTENNAIKNNGPWQSTIGSDLYGKQLGLLGLGKTGSRMAKIAKAFGMEVVVWSQNLTEEQARAAEVKLAASKEDLIRYSDFISVHLVLSDRTRNLISFEDFNLMKSSSYLINTSRAAIINQEALIHALLNQKIAGAALDVFDHEPLPADHIFREIPNLLATPHLGYVTQENYKIYYQEALENIRAFLSGKPVRVMG